MVYEIRIFGIFIDSPCMFSGLQLSLNNAMLLLSKYFVNIIDFYFPIMN